MPSTGRKGSSERECRKTGEIDIVFQDGWSLEGILRHQSIARNALCVALLHQHGGLGGKICMRWFSLGKQLAAQQWHASHHHSPC